MNPERRAFQQGALFAGIHPMTPRFLPSGRHAPPTGLPNGTTNDNQPDEPTPQPATDGSHSGNSGCATNNDARTHDWRKLGNREFEDYFAESAEDVKREIVGSGGSKFDLYEDKCTGEIFVLRKGGVGEPQPTGYRFRK